MNIVLNMGTHWNISADDEVVLVEQTEKQPRSRGRRNVRGRGERGQPQ